MYSAPVQAPTIENGLQFFYIQDNSLIAIYPSTWIKTTVLGVVLGLTNDLYKLVECESQFDAEARGKAGEVGLFQYMPSTWRYFNKLRGTHLDINNSEDQVDMTQWAWENGRQDEWTCWKLINK